MIDTHVGIPPTKFYKPQIPKDNMQYDINRPWLTLDDWQKEYVFDEEDRDNFLLAGRQSGKTTAMSMRAVELCMHHYKKGEFILVNSITEKQAHHILLKSLIYAKEKYYNKIIWKGENKPTKHRLMFKNGTGILCYAAGETGEGQRGFTIKKLMPDEASRMSEEYFIAAMPMLSVIDGSMDIASTPFGKHHKDGTEKFFYKCSKDPSFKKYYISGEDCPRHSKEFLDQQKERMTKLAYAQEYIADFTDKLKQFFDTEIVKRLQVLNRPESINKHKDYYLGVDVARMGEDLSTFEIFDGTDKKNIFHIENIITQRTLTTETTQKIFELEEKYKFKQIFIDAYGVGTGVFDQLITDNRTKRKTIAIGHSSRPLDSEEKKKTKTQKEDIYTNFKVLMENNQIKLLKDNDILQSLKSIQYDYNESGKLIIFGSDAHIADGIVRGANCSKDKSLKPYIF